LLVAGVDVDDLPEGCTIVEAMILAHGLTEDGESVFYTRCSAGLSNWTAIGLLTVALDTQRSASQETFEDDDYLDEETS
jgi:hypothetical protein